MAYQYNPRTGELISVSEFNARKKAATAAPAGTPKNEAGELLSRADAEAFDVPYGTTKGSVFGKKPVEKATSAKESEESQTLKKALPMLGQIETLYKNMVGKEYTGAGAGVLSRIKGVGRAIGAFTGTNQEAREYQSFVDSNLSIIARGLKGEVGTLTNQDIDRARAALPKKGSSPQEAATAFRLIKEQIDNNMKVLGQQSPTAEASTNMGTDRAAKIAKLREEAAAAEREASRSTASRFAAELPGAAARTLLETPARFIASGAVAPFDVGAQIAGSSGPVVTGNIPIINKPTYQAEAAQRQGEILDRADAGQPTSAMDYVNILRPFVEVPLAGLETFFLGKTAKSAATGLARRTPGVNRMFSDVRTAADTKKIANELVPKLTPTKYAFAGKKGDLTPPGMFSRGKVSVDSPTVKRTTDAVESVAADLGFPPTRIIKPGATVTANQKRVLDTIENYSESAVKPFLSNNKVQTNFDDYIKYMQEVRPPRAIRTQPEAARAFDNVRERIIEEVYRSVKSQSAAGRSFGAETDPNIYWNARKMIDNIIEEELGARTFTDAGLTGVKAAAQSLRRGTADFLDDLLRFPGQGDKVAQYRKLINDFADRGEDLSKADMLALAEQMGLQPTGAAASDVWNYFMKNLEGLYGASDNLSTRLASEQGKTLLGVYISQRPFLKKAAGLGAAVATGVGTGVGSSMIFNRD